MKHLRQNWELTPVITELPSITKNKIRANVKRLEESGHSYHALIRTGHKRYSLFSSKEDTHLLPLAVRAKLFKSGAYAFVEMSSETNKSGFKEGYGVAFDGQSILHTWLIDAPHKAINFALFMNEHLKDGGHLVMANCSPAEFASLKVSDNQIEICEPLLETLETSERYNLKDGAHIKVPGAQRNLVAVLTMALGLCAFIGFNYYETWQNDLEQAKNAKKVDVYADFKSALTQTSANVKMQLMRLSYDLSQFESLSGWEIKRLVMEPKSTTLLVDAKDGAFTDLKLWAKERGYIATMLKDEYTVVLPIEPSPVLEEPVLVPVDGVSAYIREGATSWWDEVSITEKTAVGNKKWTERVVEVGVTNWTRWDLDTFGSLINGLPVAINGADLSKTDKGYNGKLSLTIYGS